MNTVNVSGRVPMLFNMSKYCVISSKSTTSFDEAPLICSLLVKSEMEFFKPSTMALRCRATPTPARYFDSASASADFTERTLSPSAFSAAASLSRFDAIYLIQPMSGFKNPHYYVRARQRKIV